MFTRAGLLAASFAAVATISIASPAQAQYRVRYFEPGDATFTVTPYFGYAYFGHYVDGPLGTSTSGSSAALTGAQMNLNFSPWVGLVGNVAYGNSGLAFNEPDGELTHGNSGVWLFDGDLQLSAPFRGMNGEVIKPFLQLGLGAVDYNTQTSTGSQSSAAFAFNYGVGLDYPITRGLGIRLMAKDYVTHWDYNTGYTDPYGYSVYNDVFTHNFALTGGLRLAFR
jgi:hypothetical protein